MKTNSGRVRSQDMPQHQSRLRSAKSKPPRPCPSRTQHQHSLPPPSRPTRNVTVPRMGLCSPWSVFSFVVSSSSVFDAGRGFGEQSASPLASPPARKIFAAPFDVQRQPARQRQHPQPHLFPRRLRMSLLLCPVICYRPRVRLLKYSAG